MIVPKPSIFVGYPYGQKGYRIYDFHSQQIYTSLGVIFHKTTFPYRDIVSLIPNDPISVTPIPDYGNFDYASSPSTSLTLSNFQPQSLFEPPSSSQLISTETSSLVSRRVNDSSNSSSLLNTSLPHLRIPFFHHALIVIENQQPHSYSQAVQSSEWWNAMAKEIHAHESK